MKIASLAEVKARLSAYLLEVESGGPVVITRNGKAVAVLLAPIDDDDLEGLLLSRSPRFRSLLSKSRRSVRAGKGLTAAAFWAMAAQGLFQAARQPGASRLPRSLVTRGVMPNGAGRNGVTTWAY